MKKLYTGVIDLTEAKSIVGSTYTFDYDVYEVFVKSTSLILLNVPISNGGARCVSCVLSIGTYSPGQANACGMITDTSGIKNIRVYSQKAAKTVTIMYPA